MEPQTELLIDVTPSTDPAPRMSPDEVMMALQSLVRGTDPRAAVTAAVAMREEIAPWLLAELSRSPAELEMRYAGKDGDTTAHPLPMIAAYLLADFDEPRALGPILDLFQSDSKLAENLIVDWVTEDLIQIVARCCDGSDKSLDALEQAISCQAIEPSTRNLLLDAYRLVEDAGKASPVRLLGFVERLLDVPLGTPPNEWYDWLALNASYIGSHLRAPHLKPRIEALFDRGLVQYDNGFALIVSREEVAEIYAEPEKAAPDSLVCAETFEDIVETIGSFFWFDPTVKFRPNRPVVSDAPDEPMDPVDRMARDVLANQRFRQFTEAVERYNFVLPLPYVRAAPKIGRNEPCPCGSGKKHKKCCLGSSREH